VDGMPDQTRMPERPPKSWLGMSVLTGLFLFASVGAILGATGLLRTEYRANARDQAILVALGIGPYGLLVGFVFGLCANWFRRWRWRRESGHSEPRT
jgi:hypothetical protein